MATLPERLERGTHVDLLGRGIEPWVRRGALLLIAAFSIAGLANVFGQHPEATRAGGEAAVMTVSAPTGLRGGIIYQAKITIEARRELAKPSLVFDSDWYESLTINTFEPDPVDWTHRDGKNVMHYGRVPAGTKLVVRLQYQVNPTALGRRTQTVTLEDDGEEIVTLTHKATIYP